MWIALLNRSGKPGSACVPPSELSWVWGSTCQIDVDFPADVHPCVKTKVHAIWSVDEFLELLLSDALSDFPDTESRTLRAYRAEAVVKETRFQISGNCIIPASSRCHCRLRCFPPLLSFPCPKLMVNVEEFGSHQSVLDML